MTIHEILIAQGYRVVEDAWNEHSRVTYIHNDDASREHVAALAESLRPLGWKLHSRKLRVLQRSADGYEIELEPGGSEVTGHFLHYMQPRA